MTTTSKDALDRIRKLESTTRMLLQRVDANYAQLMEQWARIQDRDAQSNKTALRAGEADGKLFAKLNDLAAKVAKMHEGLYEATPLLIGALAEKIAILEGRSTPDGGAPSIAL